MPGLAAICRFEEAAVRAFVAVAILPGPKARFPQRGINDVGIRRVDRHIGAPSAWLFVEYFLPGLATVAGAEDAALFIRPVGMAEHRGEEPIRIVRIDGERRNLLTIS